MTTATQFIETARSLLGRNEADGTHKYIIDVYNKCKPLPRGYKVKYTDPWCATFVSAVAILTGATDIIPRECSCAKMIEGFKAIGCFVEDENRIANVGDIVFYDWNDNGNGDNKGTPDHVGIVVTAGKYNMTVIEGNYNNKVQTRILAHNGRYIRGYGVPKYSNVVSNPSEPVSKPSEKVDKGIDLIAKDVIAGKYGNGHVTRMTNIYNAVKKRVNELTKG